MHQQMTRCGHCPEAKTKAFRQCFVGHAAATAITLNTTPAEAAKGRSNALTDNYLPVLLAQSLPANRLVDVDLAGIGRTGILGLSRSNLAMADVAVAM